MRCEALTKLKFEDLKQIEFDEFTIYQITVYAGFKEQYNTFCTPECYEALQIYFRDREKYGESSLIHPSFVIWLVIQHLH